MIEEKEDSNSWFESELFRFFALQNKRVERGEISTETIKNYFKPKATKLGIIGNMHGDRKLTRI